MKLELKIVNVAINQHEKLINKIISFFLNISCISKDTTKTNNGSVNKTNPRGSILFKLNI